MNPQPALSASIALPGQGRVVRAFGDEASFHLDAERTGGRLTMFTLITPPGGGPPLHYHLNEDEWFVVQEGRVEFLVDGKKKEVAPGGVVYLPRNVVHTYRNIGNKALRQLVSMSPSGFETFFTRCAEEFAKPGGPDMNRIVQIAGEHGIHFVQA
jgi:quercetin dioxygenase-like cupin family protein